MVKPRVQTVAIKKYPWFAVKLVERGCFIMWYLTKAMDMSIRVEIRTETHWRKGTT